MSISERLRHERERLGLTQPQLGQIVGVGKTTVLNWEKGASDPGAVQMAALAAAGVDVLYVITGQRSAPASSPPISREEAALLDNYRHSPEQQQRLLRETSAAFARRGDDSAKCA